MNVAELMTEEIAVVDAATSVADAAKMMQIHNTGCIVVLENDRLTGIITERDMVLGCLIDGHTSSRCQVYKHMTALSETATPLTNVGDALLTMMDNEVNYLPVVNSAGEIAGLLYSEDLSRAIEQDNDLIAI